MSLLTYRIISSLWSVNNQGIIKDHGDFIGVSHRFYHGLSGSSERQHGLQQLLVWNYSAASGARRAFLVLLSGRTCSGAHPRKVQGESDGRDDEDLRTHGMVSS